jgi:hypothetical protein
MHACRRTFSSGAELRIPAGEQDGGVVLEDTPLMPHDRVDQAADGLGRGVARRCLASEEVDHPVLPEEVACFVAGLDDAVGEEGISSGYGWPAPR